MGNWTQPICERCWIERYCVVNEGKVAIQRPTRVSDPYAENCSYCGQITIFGVYVRDDPHHVPYPQKKVKA